MARSDRLFGLLRSDAVPGDVLDIGGVPIELHALHGKDNVKQRHIAPPIKRVEIRIRVTAN
jgi:hypothetical protein